MRHNNRHNYDDYDENDIYDTLDEDYEEELEEENEELLDDDIEEDDGDSFETLQPFYDKNNPADFFKIMEDYRSGKPYKVEVACEQAIQALEGPVRHIIKKKYARYSNRFYEDLLQQGRLGICKGLMTYEPEKSKPATFFYYYILHEMQDFINSMVNKTTAHYDTSVRRIKKLIDKYNREGRDYSSIDISIDTGLPLQTVEHSLNLINSSELSIEGKIDDIGTLADILPSEEKSPEQQYIEEENMHALDVAIHRHLDAAETRVIELIYGIHGCQPMPNKMISKELNMPSDRIRRYQVSALCKLRSSKELRSVHADMLKDTLVELDETNAVPLLADIDLDAALEIMKEVEIDF